MKTKTKKRDLLSMGDITPSELSEILSITKNLKKSPLSKSDTFKGKSFALVFAKPSLRTRVSFEVGINELGGSPITLKMDEISIGAREDVKDIAKVLSRYVHGIIIRTYEQAEIEDLAQNSSIPIINALSNDEHPCQAIADIFTIHETFGDKENLKLTYIGDGNNVTHSLLLGCAQAGINVTVSSPKGYYPEERYIKLAKEINPNITIEIIEDPIKASENAHILYTDVWTSMGQEKEKTERIKVFKPYQINENILKVASKDAIVMHCLPAHRGEEITAEAFDKYEEVIYRQAENRLHAQKAILLFLSSSDH